MADNKIGVGDFDSAAKLLFPIALDSVDTDALEKLLPIVAKTKEWQPTHEECAKILKSWLDRENALKLLASISVFTDADVKDLWEKVVPTLTEDLVFRLGDQIAVVLRLHGLEVDAERIQFWHHYAFEYHVVRGIGLMSREELDRYISAYVENPTEANWKNVDFMIRFYTKQRRLDEAKRLFSMYSHGDKAQLEWIKTAGLLAFSEGDYESAERHFKRPGRCRTSFHSGISLCPLPIN